MNFGTSWFLGFLPVQDFQVSLADFTIHQDYAFDKIANTVYNDIGQV